MIGMKKTIIKTRLGVEPSTTRFAGDWHHRFEAYAARRHGRLVVSIILEDILSEPPSAARWVGNRRPTGGTGKPGGNDC